MERVPGSTGGTTGTSTQVDQATEQTKQQTQQLAQQARQQASELANRGTEQAKSQLANQKHNASQRMVPFQSALRETAQQLRRQGQGSAGDYANRAADQLERFSVYLRETEVEEIMEEVRGIARRRPGLFLGGGAAIGFFATRFLKSTSEQQRSSYAGYDFEPTPTTTGRTAVSYGADETATALPPGSVEGSPTTGRTPLAGQPPTAGQPPIGTGRTEEPPTTSGGSDAR